MRTTPLLILVILFEASFAQAQNAPRPSEAEIRFYEQVIATRDEARKMCAEMAVMVKSNLDLYAALDKKVSHPDDKAAVEIARTRLNEANTLAAPICEAFALLDDDRAADITKKDFPRFQKEKMPTDTRSFYINLYKLALLDLYDTILWWNRHMGAMNESAKKKPQPLVIKELLTGIVQDAAEMKRRLDAIKERYPILAEPTRP